MLTWNKPLLLILPFLLMVQLWGCDSAPVNDDDGNGNDTESRFTVFFDSNGLSNSYVNGLATDYFRSGLWVATQKGVSFYSFSDSAWTIYGTESGLPNLKIISVAVNLGTVWVGTKSGASYLSDSLWVDMPASSNLPSEYITAIASMPEPDYSLWFGTRSGVSRRSTLGEWTTYTTQNGLSSDDITSIARDSSGKVWVGSQYGLNSFDGSKWTVYTTVLSSTLVQTVFADSYGNVWAGTSNGIVKFTGNTLTKYGTYDGLPSPVINAFAEDFNHVLWVGTNQGLAFLNGATWIKLSLPDAVDGLPVMALASDAITRSLWIGTTNGLVRYQAAAE